jgi:hypothetical protein
MMINEAYLKEALKFQSRGWEPGEVASAALELHVRKAAAA